MRVAFVDFDGVLITYGAESSRSAGTDRQFHPPSVINQNTLVQRTRCKLVISSPWRLLVGIDFIAVPRHEGIGGEIDGITPSLEYRGREIKAWLTDAADRVTSFVIIDNMYRSIGDPFQTSLERTKDNRGFDTKALSEALEILG